MCELDVHLFLVLLKSYYEIGELKLHAGSLIFDLVFMIFDLFLEMVVGIKNGFQFLLEGLLLSVQPGGVGQIASCSVVDNAGYFGVVEIGFAGIFVIHSSMSIYNYSIKRYS